MLITDASDMNNDRIATDESVGGRKAYSVNVHAKAQSNTSCSFCWFVLGLYPTLTGMTERDASTFKAHLAKLHGLKEEIQE
jgi:hypothetical protein